MWDVLTYSPPSWKTTGQLFVLSAQEPLPRHQGLRFFCFPLCGPDVLLWKHTKQERIPEAKHNLTVHRNSATRSLLVDIRSRHKPKKPHFRSPWKPLNETGDSSIPFKRIWNRKKNSVFEKLIKLAGMINFQ